MKRRRFPSRMAALLWSCAWALPGAAADRDPRKADFASLMAEKQRAQHVQAWHRYAFQSIPRVQEPPLVDGRVEVREWTAAARIAYVLQMATGVQVRDRADWLLCYTEDHLYIAFQFERPPTARSPSPRDFFELLIDHDHDHGRYCNLAGNLEGKLWDGIGPNVDRKAWTPNWRYAARLTEFGWEGEVAIPFADFPELERAPEPGAVWGVDLVRNECTPDDRVAHWSWRSTWHATKDLAHIMFSDGPVTARIEDVGWMPQHKKMGAKLALLNMAEKSVQVSASLELRKAEEGLAMGFLPALDSALTEDLDAAIGATVADEVARALEPFIVQHERRETVTLPAHSARQIELTVPDEPGDYLVCFTLRDDETLLAAMAVPFSVTVPLDLALRSYLYSAGVLEYAVDLQRVRDRLTTQTTLTIEARTTKGGPVVTAADHGNVSGKDEVRGSLRLDPTPGETYFVSATLRNGDTETIRNEVPLILPEKPEWIGSQVGRSKLVPRPFVPLEATPRSSETLTIRYDWPGDTIFPEIRVKGKPILAEPLALVCRGADGTELDMVVESFSLQSHEIEQAVYAFRARVGALATLSGQVTVEFDGFLWYDLVLSPAAAGTALTGFRFTATLKNEVARIYTIGRIPEGTNYAVPSVPGCGRVPAEGLVYPYTFQTWVGYVEGGLQWYCESARNWSNEDPKQAIAIRPGETSTQLLVSFVDKAMALEGPVDWHFGLQPTPARKRVGGLEDHAYFQMHGTPSLEEPDPELEKTDPKLYGKVVRAYGLVHSGLADRGVKAVILFNGYNDIMGYPGIKDQEKSDRLHAFVKHMHSQGIKVLVYNGWGISTKCPEWDSFGSELVNLPLKNSGYSTYWASPVSLYADLFVHRMAEHMREYDLDGIYMDSTTSINYSLHPNGCRWVDAEGRARGSFPVRAMREFTKRICKVLSGEVVKDGIFYNHHSPQANACVENFVSVRCPSEFAQQYDGELDEAFIDYFLAKNGGVQYGYHTELTNKNWMTRIRKTLNELNPIAVPLGVSFKAINFASWTPRDYSVRGQPMHRIWQAMAWLGSASAQYLPWWRNSAYISTDPGDGVVTAIWLKKGEKALVCVSNLVNEPRQITTTLDLNALGLDRLVVQDAILDKPVAVQGGTLSLAIEERRWRLLKVTPAE